MKVLIIADTHACMPEDMKKLEDVSGFDFILTLGDISSFHFDKLIKHNKPILGVVGNHDSFNQISVKGGVDLHANLTMIGDISLIGIRGSHKYKNAYYPAYTHEESIILTKTLEKADILVTHTSPLGFHEKDYDVHSGLSGIREYILKHQPKYNIHGHQHVNQVSYLGKTKIIGIFGAKILDYETGNIESIF